MLLSYVNKFTYTKVFLAINAIMELTRRRIPGMASILLGEKPLARRRRCTTIAATTAVMKVVQRRNASLYLSAVLGENSNMKL